MASDGQRSPGSSPLLLSHFKFPLFFLVPRNEMPVFVSWLFLSGTPQQANGFCLASGSSCWDPAGRCVFFRFAVLGGLVNLLHTSASPCPCEFHASLITSHRFIWYLFTIIIIIIIIISDVKEVRCTCPRFYLVHIGCLTRPEMLSYFLKDYMYIFPANMGFLHPKDAGVRQSSFWSVL